MTRIFRLQVLGPLIIAILALVSAVGSAYVAVATRPTPVDVEHIVELRTVDKFAEVQRRFDSMDKQLNRVLDKLDRLDHKE